MGTLSKKRRAEIARIIKDRSIRMRGSARVAIRRRATAALKTHAGLKDVVFLGRMRRLPLSADRRNAVIDDFKEHPGHFSEYMTKQLGTYPSLVSKIKDTFEDDNPYPFAVVRNLYPTCAFPWSSTQRASNREEWHLHDEWYLRDLVYEFISSGLIKITGEAVHRCREPGEPPWREYTTSSNEEINVRSDGQDLPLRYRQATTDLMMTGESEDVRNTDVAARVAIFVCVENPISWSASGKVVR